MDVSEPSSTPHWMTQPPPPAIPPPPRAQPAGWYRDPWRSAPWRWWDGTNWTPHTHGTVAPESLPPESPSGPSGTPQPLTPAGAAATVHQARKPRLPSFLSVPVVITAIPGLALIVVGAILVPVAIALGFVPLLIVAPVLIWMDRIEPEPWSARLHAFLWGAFAAGAVSLLVNTIVASATSDTIAAVVSAPLIEETMKALAIVWALRRREVDGVMDGLVYAGWSALGFAIIEDFLYFFNAEGEDLLLETFIGRALFTPFAHPLFTAWTGLALGFAVKRRSSLISAWWGLALAVCSHALWNGSLTLAEDEGTMIVTGVVVIGFGVLFVVTALGVILLRRRDQRRYAELLPWLSQRYGLSPDRTAMLSDPGARRRARRALPRAERRVFDSQASALARLAALFDHPGEPNPADEARLISQLAADRDD